MYTGECEDIMWPFRANQVSQFFKMRTRQSGILQNCSCHMFCLPFSSYFFLNLKISFILFHYFLLEHLFLSVLVKYIRNWQRETYKARFSQNTETNRYFLIVKSQTSWLREWKQGNMYAVSTFSIQSFQPEYLLHSFCLLQQYKRTAECHQLMHS